MHATLTKRRCGRLRRGDASPASDAPASRHDERGVAVHRKRATAALARPSLAHVHALALALLRTRRRLALGPPSSWATTTTSPADAAGGRGAAVHRQRAAAALARPSLAHVHALALALLHTRRRPALGPPSSWATTTTSPADAGRRRRRPGRREDTPTTGAGRRGPGRGERHRLAVRRRVRSWSTDGVSRRAVPRHAGRQRPAAALGRRERAVAGRPTAAGRGAVGRGHV